MGLGYCLGMILVVLKVWFWPSLSSCRNMKFKVGDFVVGNELSLKVYSYTNKVNGYGVVKGYDGDGNLVLRWFTRDGKEGCSFDVNDNCFVLCRCRLKLNRLAKLTKSV